MLYENILSKYEYEIKINNKNRTVVVVKVSDRSIEIKCIVEELQKHSFVFSITKTSFSSFDTIIVESTKPILIVLKNKKGMSQTTLNSTITELAPCIAFHKNLKPKDENELFDICLNHVNDAKVFVDTNDFVVGVKYVKTFKTSDKFEEKIKNAFAITHYLFALNEELEIESIVWGYRKKPHGVEANHKGDIFIKQSGKWFGISLKAGKEDSKEPQLNTYIKPIYEYFEISTKPLVESLYEIVYSNLGCTKDYCTTDRNKTLKILEKLERDNKELYDDYYVMSLSTIRDALINIMINDRDKTSQWILENICSSFKTPLIILKVFDDKVIELNDSDVLTDAIKNHKNMNISVDKNSRQNFEIVIDDVVMKMTVRSNKCGVQHKLGQFFNMSVKFNGILKNGK